MTVEPQAKRLKSIRSPTKSQVTASRAPTRLKSAVLGYRGWDRPKRNRLANSAHFWP